MGHGSGVFDHAGGRHGRNRIFRHVARKVLSVGSFRSFLLFRIYFRPLIHVAALWAVTFSGAAIALAVVFRDGVRA